MCSNLIANTAKQILPARKKISKGKVKFPHFVAEIISFHSGEVANFNLPHGSITHLLVYPFLIKFSRKQECSALALALQNREMII